MSDETTNNSDNGNENQTNPETTSTENAATEQQAAPETPAVETGDAVTPETPAAEVSEPAPTSVPSVAQTTVNFRVEGSLKGALDGVDPNRTIGEVMKEMKLTTAPSSFNLRDLFTDKVLKAGTKLSEIMANGHVAVSAVTHSSGG